MTTHTPSVLRTVLCLATLVGSSLVSGCITKADLDEPNDGDTDPGSTDDSGSEGGASPSSTTADDGVSEATAGDGGTTAGPSPATPEETCAGYCEYSAMCWEGGGEECMIDCLEQLSRFDVVDPTCSIAAEAYVSCIGASPECDEDNCIVPALAVGGCEAEWSCSFSVNGFIDAPGCTWEMQCHHGPESRVIECDGETCTCIQDGTKTGECPYSVGVCTGGTETEGTECCGWLDAFGNPV